MKEVKRINKSGKENTKNTSYKLLFLYSARFIASLLSNLLYNFGDKIQKIKSKHGKNNKIYKTCGIKHKDCECCLEYTNVGDNLILYKFYDAIEITKKSLMKI